MSHRSVCVLIQILYTFQYLLAKYINNINLSSRIFLELVSVPAAAAQTENNVLYSNGNNNQRILLAFLYKHENSSLNQQIAFFKI